MADNSITIKIKGDISNLESEIEKASSVISSTQKEIAKGESALAKAKSELADAERKHAKTVDELVQSLRAQGKEEKDISNAVREANREHRNSISILKQNKKVIEADLATRREQIRLQKTTINNANDEIAKKKKLLGLDKDLAQAIKNLNKTTDSMTNSVVRHLRQIETLIIAYYAIREGFRNTIGVGLEVNKMMEDNTSGIAALLSANTQMVLSNGQVVDSYQKFIIGQQVAAGTLEDLRKASVKTYATFPQLTEIFQQAIGQTLSMGDAFGTTVEEINSNTVKLSQRMSNIAGAIGMPMDRVREEIRSLLSGNASTDSLISTMIFGSPGEANKAIRMAKERGQRGVSDMLDAMLQPFDALENVDSYTRSLLTLQDAWTQTMMKLSEPVFEDLKAVFTDLAKSLNENRDEIAYTFKETYEAVKDNAHYLKELVALYGAYKVGGWLITGLGTVLTISKELVTLKKSLVALTKTELAAEITLQSVKSGRGLGTIITGAVAVGGAVYVFNELNKALDNVTESFDGLGTSVKKADITPISAQIKATAQEIKQLETLMSSSTWERMPQKAKENYERVLGERKKFLEQLNRMQESTLGKEQKGQLLTKLGIDKKLIEDARKENQKAIDEIIQIQEQITKAEKQLALLNTALSSKGLTTTAKESTKSDIGELTTYIANKQDELEKINKQRTSKELADWQTYFESIQEYEAGWAIESVKVWDQYEKYGKEVLDRMLAYSQKEYFDKFKESQKEIAPSREIKEWSKNYKSVLEVIQTPSEKINAQFQSLEKFVKENFKPDDIKKFYKAWDEALSKAADSFNFGEIIASQLGNGVSDAIQQVFDGKFDLTNFSQSIASSIGNALVSQSTSSIAQSLASGSAISGSALTGGALGIGAMAISSVLSRPAKPQDIYNVLTNPNVTTVLGGGAEYSKSITKSLGILEDFAEPQYNTLLKMSDSLTKLNQNIEGLAGVLLKTSEFALGVGGVNAQQFSRGGTTLSKVASTQAGSMLGGALLGGGLGTILGGALGYVTDWLGLGGGYNWTRLENAGIAFGQTGAQPGQTYTGSAGYYGQITSQQAFTPQTLQELIDGFSALAFQSQAYEEMSKSWYGSASYRYWSTTTYQELDKELVNAVQNIFSDMRDTIIQGSQTLGEDVTSQIDSLLVDLGQINLMGLTGEDLTNKLNEAFSGQADKFVEQLFNVDISGTTTNYLVPFQQIGEGLFETLSRVAAGMEEADFYINRLGYSFDSVNFKDIVNKQGQVGIEALTQSIIALDEAAYGADNGVVQIVDLINTSTKDVYDMYKTLDNLRPYVLATDQALSGLTMNMIAGAGSIDELSSSLKGYTEIYLTENERLQLNVGIMQKEFERLNITMPMTQDSFRTLVEGIDTTSESGQDLYGRVISLSEAFGELTQSSEDYRKEISLRNETQAERVERLAQEAETLGSINLVASDTKQSLENLIDVMIQRAELDGFITTAEHDAIIAMQEYIDAVYGASNDLISAGTLIENFALGRAQAIMDSFKAISDYVDTVLNDISTQDAFSKFNESYQAFVVGLVDNSSNLANLTSDLLNNAKEYDKIIQQTATTKYEEQYNRAVLAAQLAGLEPTYKETTLTDLANLTEQYLNEDSPIVTYLRAIAMGVTSLSYQDYQTAQQLHEVGVPYFAEGGIVTKPTLGVIGEAGYPEAVVPIKNPNDPLGSASLLAEMRALRKDNEDMLNILISMHTTGVRQLSTQRGILAETINNGGTV